MLLQLMVVAAQMPEMARLAKALAGDWNTVEVVQYAKPVPNGQGRHGTDRVHVAGGGTVLVFEGHTNGSIGGELQWYSVFWWDSSDSLYRYLTCFRAGQDSGCQLRGTAHWEGANFVNEYEEPEDGKMTKMRDVWSDITPNSHTLTEFHDTGSGGWKAFVVNHDTRMP